MNSPNQGEELLEEKNAPRRCIENKHLVGIIQERGEALLALLDVMKEYLPQCLDFFYLEILEMKRLQARAQLFKGSRRRDS